MRLQCVRELSWNQTSLRSMQVVGKRHDTRLYEVVRWCSCLEGLRCEPFQVRGDHAGLSSTWSSCGCRGFRKEQGTWLFVEVFLLLGVGKEGELAG